MTFLQKSHGEWDEIKKPAYIWVGDEGSGAEDGGFILANRVKEEKIIVKDDFDGN